MHLEVKKIKVDIFSPLRQYFFPVPYYHPPSRGKLLIPPKKGGRDYENLFPNVFLEVSFFKTGHKRMHFLFKGPFGDFKQLIAWCLQLLSFCHCLP